MFTDFVVLEVSFILEIFNIYTLKHFASVYKSAKKKFF